jgi:hypothetical protein
LTKVEQKGRECLEEPVAQGTVSVGRREIEREEVVEYERFEGKG